MNDWARDALHQVEPDPPELHYGVIVASGTVALTAPIFHPLDAHRRGRSTFAPEPPYWHVYGDGVIGFARPGADVCEWGYDDQHDPVGDWGDGRFGWLLSDVKPTTERCPGCWGSGYEDEPTRLDQLGHGGVWKWKPCPWCSTDAPAGHARVVGAGVCPPIPVSGSQRVWYWQRRQAAST